MLKLVLTYLSQAVWARRIVQKWGFAKRTAARFVAGETLDEAITVVKDLNRRGIFTTLDHLGENVTSREEAIQAADEIITIIDRLISEGVPSGISIKLSQIGLVLDPKICRQNLLRILKNACERNIFIRIDMEDSSLTQATLDLFKSVRREGFEDCTGIVIQSSLFRSQEDVKDLLSESCKIRICKGAYKEPRTVAFPKKKSVDENFDRITELLLESSLKIGSSVKSDGSFPPLPAIATHDPSRVDHALAYADRIGLDKKGLEFQMLHGIRDDIQENLRSQGYAVRVYVPYGSEWYPYFVRRLAERPANLWFFLSNLVRF
jgi:proline dehydrogenase